MNILLTGASGFVGQNTLPVLLALPGTRISVAVRSPRGEATGQGVTQHIVGDIDGSTDWSEALQGIDIVVHLAARVHVMHDPLPDPLGAFREVNVHGTMALANQAVKAGVKRMVFLSSVKVLGEHTLPGQAWTEESSTDPQDPYGVSKCEAEVSLRELAAHSPLEVVILRPPLVYGPGVSANFAALMSAVRRGIPMPLGAIHNRRSLVAVGNLANAIGLCATHPLAANHTFLVSDQQDMSTTDLVHHIATAMDKSAHLIPVPASLLRLVGRIGNKSAAVQRLCSDLAVDSSKLTRELGWRPPFSVADAMRRAVSAGHGT